MKWLWESGIPIAQYSLKYTAIASPYPQVNRVTGPTYWEVGRKANYPASEKKPRSGLTHEASD